MLSSVSLQMSQNLHIHKYKVKWATLQKYMYPNIPHEEV